MIACRACQFVLADLWREGAALRYPVVVETRTGRIIVRCPKCGERTRLSVNQIREQCKTLEAVE